MNDDPSKTINIRGNRISLDDTRSVSVGRSDEEPDTTFVELINSAGDVTRFSLSREAAEALRDLLIHNQLPDGRWVAA